jgi:hypothetical protein
MAATSYQNTRTSDYFASRATYAGLVMVTYPPSPHRRRRRAAVAAGVAVVVGAGVITAVLLGRDGHSPAAAAPAPTSAAAVSPSAAPLTTTTPTPRPSPTVAHDAVPAAAPTAFTFTGPRFTIKARVCAMANVRPYDPPGDQRHTVCWVRDGFGVKPASDAATSYLFGHSWSVDPHEVLNRASAPVTREILHARPDKLDGVETYPSHALDGYRIVLHTRTGDLTYEVRRVYAVRKALLGGIASWEDATVRNRVVLTTCAELGGADYDYNVVIEAFLQSSRRR